jgi:hypothetical protein
MEEKMFKNLDRYRVVSALGIESYKCVTSHLSEDQVIGELLKMYEGQKTIYRIYKNNEFIMKINHVPVVKDYEIRNIVSGQKWKSIEDFMKSLKLQTKEQAHYYLNNLEKYEWKKKRI